MKCPRCGSKNHVAILYDEQHFDGDIRNDIHTPGDISGKSGNSETGPQLFCKDCKRGFATPPKVTSKNNVEDLRDVITSIYFYIGGYFQGYQQIEIERRGNTVILSIKPYPNSDEVFSEEISEKEWKRIVNKLFCKLYIHEWKKRYVNPGILDGEGWELEFKLTRGRRRSYHGKNAYPALWKELKSVFRPYFKKYEINIIGHA